MAVTSAGSMTTAQLATLKADILASPDLNTYPHTGDGIFAITEKYNLQASPNFTVWKTTLPLGEMGDAIDATELVGLTTGKLTQLQTLLLFGPINPSLPNRRSAMDQIFSAASGTITRPALQIVYRRFALRIEKLLATGTGSDAAPATMGFEGRLSTADVEAALV